MARGQHRAAESVRRSFLRIPSQVTRPPVAVGAGVALLTLALAPALWTTLGPQPPLPAAAVVTGQQRDLAANALSAAVSLRTQERADRDMPRTSGPAAPVTRTPIRTPAKTPTQTPDPVTPEAPKVVGQLWVTTNLTVRSGPSVDADRIDRLEALSRVDVTGVTKDGWTQVVVDGRVGWVKSTYVSTTKPTPQPASPAPGVSAASCRISPAIEPHLTSHARAVYRAVCAAYGSSVSAFGGYRPGDGGDHGSGRAVDIMVSGEPGKEIARYVQAHARELGVTYVIYQQRIWLAGRPTSQWRFMEDRGSTTANHYDHVHVSVS